MNVIFIFIFREGGFFTAGDGVLFILFLFIPDFFDYNGHTMRWYISNFADNHAEVFLMGQIHLKVEEFYLVVFKLL